MTTQEFSNEFDVLYNNIMSNQAPGLDEYEKSVFLTKALNELVKDYFNPKGNKYQEGFDGSNKRQYDFSSLIRTERLFNVSSHIDETERLDSRSIPFLFPKNYFLVINEIITDTNNNKYSVLPITYDTYALKMLKPYQYPVKRQAWRIFTDKKNFNYGFLNVEYNEDSPKKTAPVIVLSSYASDKRRLKFTLSYKPKMGESYSILVNRELNDYDLEEIKCTVIGKAGLQLEDILLMILDAAENGTPGELYKDVLINNNVSLDHWDYFKLFSFPNRIEIMDIIGTPPELTEVFSITTEVLYRPIAEIIGRFYNEIKSYFVRYVKIPNPIILDDLPLELSILNMQSKSECELPEEIHSEILLRAVELAKAAYQGDLNSTIEIGKRSE